MSAPPPWRRLSPTSPAARGASLFTLMIGLAALTFLIAAPLLADIRAAKTRAALLEQRADTLRAATAQRRAEAEFISMNDEDLAAARGWLDENAPRTGEDAAALDLISGIRLLAAQAHVALEAASPLNATPREAAPGLRVIAAEARITTDHGGLARFLHAIESARPLLRAAELEISARSPAALEEDERLSVIVIINALSRPLTE